MFALPIFTVRAIYRRAVRNSPVEPYKCGISCYFLVFSGLFPSFFYDLVTAATACVTADGIPRPALWQAAKIAMGRGTDLDYVRPEAQAVVDDLNELDNEEYEL